MTCRYDNFRQNDKWKGKNYILHSYKISFLYNKQAFEVVVILILSVINLFFETATVTMETLFSFSNYVKTTKLPCLICLNNWCVIEKLSTEVWGYSSVVEQSTADR